ncbi:hypothetical protein G6F22_015945 [Rhizopus arrhizus]|nr:hypothetical protein G6F22_015945 [Rhizopus arrhizus]
MVAQLWARRNRQRGLVDVGAVHGHRLEAPDPAIHHLVALPDDTGAAPGAIRNAGSAAFGLHQVRARPGPEASRHPLRPCAEEHDGACHHDHRPAAGRHHRLRHRHRDRVPVAGHGPLVHPGGPIRRRAGHGRVPVPDRAGVRGDQPDRRSSRPCLGLAPGARGHRGDRAAGAAADRLLRGRLGRAAQPL